MEELQPMLAHLAGTVHPGLPILRPRHNTGPTFRLL